jgi:hypothetical protein
MAIIVDGRRTDHLLSRMIRALLLGIEVSLRPFLQTDSARAVKEIRGMVEECPRIARPTETASAKR